MPIIINPIFNTADEITQKKYETQLEYSKIVNWGRQNPEKFISFFLGVELNDAQKYAVMNMWQTRQSALVCCRSFGKSFLISPYIMTRTLLFPNCKCHIIAPTGPQAAQTFSKLEDIALGKIASLLNTTTTFVESCVSQGKNVSPFSHSKNGSKVSLYNGSEINSLISVPENIVGGFTPTLNPLNCWEP